MGLILLDRDGVINVDTAEGITHPDQLKLISGAGEALAKLKAAGHALAVITNQSVVGKGLISEDELSSIHMRLKDLLAAKGASLDAIFYCPDHPNAPTHRRKPNAGMLEEALAEFGGNPAATPMVGDALRDLQAASAAQCQPHLVRTGKGTLTEADSALNALANVQIHDDLACFATYWLRQAAALP